MDKSKEIETNESALSAPKLIEMGCASEETKGAFQVLENPVGAPGGQPSG